MFDGEEPSSDKLNRAMQVLRAFLRTKERSVPEKPVGESSRPIFSVQKASFDMLTPLTGLVLVSRYNSFSDYVCPPHAQSIYHHFQRHTLLKGWWSLHGFIRAPIVLSE